MREVFRLNSFDNMADIYAALTYSSRADWKQTGNNTVFNADGVTGLQEEVLPLDQEPRSGGMFHAFGTLFGVRLH